MNTSRPRAASARALDPRPPDPARPPGRRVLRISRNDLAASVVVFLVAVPLSLGIAVASGAPIMAGLIAAVVGAVVAGLLGGSPLQVSGPAAGLTVIVAELVDRFGWEVTGLITVGAGVLQMVFGLTRLARFAQAIPPAVVHGMLAGIGITIALAQLNVVFGGSTKTGALASLLALPGSAAAVSWPALLLGVLVMAVMLAWPRLPARVTLVPGALVAVVLATTVSLATPDVVRVRLDGTLLDAFALPVLPSGNWFAVVGAMLTVALIASVESLLSAVAVERMRPGLRTDVDRELLGQGAANTVSGLVGGLPVTGVIVRSSANVRAGARTRASAVLHGVWIAVFAIVLVGVIELIPMAALAGLLVVVGLQLVKPADIRSARAQGDLVVYLATVAGVAALNLLEGVLLGLALAGAGLVWRALRVRLRGRADPDGTRTLVVQGTLSFLSVPRLARELGTVPAGTDVTVRLETDYLDHAAYDHLTAWKVRHEATGGSVRVIEPGESGARPAPDVPLGRRYASWSQWQGAEVAAHEPQQPLLAGLAAYHAETREEVRPRMRELADGQSPQTMMITCADSRVLPHMITHSGPGDVFTVQNVGNLVGADATSAAVAFASDVLRTPVVAVCGHSGCGAMGALLRGGAHQPDELGAWLARGRPALAAWRHGHPVGRAAARSGYDEVDQLAMVNVAVQLDRLHENGRGLATVGLYLHIPTAEVLVLDDRRRRFVPLEEREAIT